MIRVSDHALLRFLERSGAVDVTAFRTLLAASLERGRRTAQRAGIADYMIVADGLKYVVEADVLVTVLDERMGMARRPGERR